MKTARLWLEIVLIGLWVITMIVLGMQQKRIDNLEELVSGLSNDHAPLRIASAPTDSSAWKAIQP
jgi:hypothetical protein